MRRLLLLIAVLAAACDSTPNAQQRTSAERAELRTINSVPPRPAVLEPPPMLSDEAPPPKPKVMPWETPTAVVLSPDDEKVRGALPFSPAIAMDPVDGSKISIRAHTPMHEYNGKIYYFSSEANRRAFIAGPEPHLTGKYTRL